MASPMFPSGHQPGNGRPSTFIDVRTTPVRVSALERCYKHEGMTADRLAAIEFPPGMAEGRIALSFLPPTEDCGGRQTFRLQRQDASATHVISIVNFGDLIFAEVWQESVADVDAMIVLNAVVSSADLPDRVTRRPRKNIYTATTSPSGGRHDQLMIMNASEGRYVVLNGRGIGGISSVRVLDEHRLIALLVNRDGDGDVILTYDASAHGEYGFDPDVIEDNRNWTVMDETDNYATFLGEPIVLADGMTRVLVYAADGTYRNATIRPLVDGKPIPPIEWSHAARWTETYVIGVLDGQLVTCTRMEDDSILITRVPANEITDADAPITAYLGRTFPVPSATLRI